MKMNHTTAQGSVLEPRALQKPVQVAGLVGEYERVTQEKIYHWTHTQPDSKEVVCLCLDPGWEKVACDNL